MRAGKGFPLFLEFSRSLPISTNVTELGGKCRIRPTCGGIRTAQKGAQNTPTSAEKFERSESYPSSGRYGAAAFTRNGAFQSDKDLPTLCNIPRRSLRRSLCLSPVEVCVFPRCFPVSPFPRFWEMSSVEVEFRDGSGDRRTAVETRAQYDMSHVSLIPV
jgi:hypothetical protein